MRDAVVVTGPVRVTLLTGAGCGLCDVARERVREICADLVVAWAEIDVDSDRELRAEYGDRLPVILIDGAEHGYFRVEEGRLRAALSG
ncbi:glutaredoxin family protein [soil metagenome]